MISTEKFFNNLVESDIRFFCGVPDSLLKNICAKITDELDDKSHVITANEGSAIGLASGYHLATGKVPMVYMQNSGLGNTVNPLTSLTAPEVYGIPMLLMIGWRGEPGVKDEPQHVKKGKITLPLLDTMEIPYAVLPDDDKEANETIIKAKETALKNSSPFALVIRKGLFDKYSLKNSKSDQSNLEREEAIQVILKNTDEKKSVFFGNTGKIGRELYEVRRRLEQSGESDFLNVGSMGHTSQIALGVSMNTDKTVYCLDGDGSLIMHLGGLTNIGHLAGSNYVHVILNNFAHDSVGGQPTIADKVDFIQIAKACGYKNCLQVDSEESLVKALADINSGPSFIEVKVKKGARSDLGRPKEAPSENKNNFMNFLKK